MTHLALKSKNNKYPLTKNNQKYNVEKVKAYPDGG